MGNTDFSKNSSEIALLIIIIIFTTIPNKTAFTMRSNKSLLYVQFDR